MAKLMPITVWLGITLFGWELESGAGGIAGTHSLKAWDTAPSPEAQLRGTRKLVQDDSLIPTQNRTQAMRVEAATGHLPGREEESLQRSQSPWREGRQGSTGSWRGKSAIRKNSHRWAMRYWQPARLSHTRAEILKAARNP